MTDIDNVDRYIDNVNINPGKTACMKLSVGSTILAIVVVLDIISIALLAETRIFSF